MDMQSNQVNCAIETYTYDMNAHSSNTSVHVSTPVEPQCPKPEASRECSIIMTFSTEGEDCQNRNREQLFNGVHSSQQRQQQTEKSIVTKSVIEDYQVFVKLLRRNGCNRRSDDNQPPISVKPDWLDEKLFRHAQSVYQNHFMGLNFAHLSGLLMLVRVDSIYRTLSKTGKSDSVSKLFKRYYHTVMHVKSWYEGDIFQQDSSAQRSLMIVRGMHNRASSELNSNVAMDPSDPNNNLQSNNDQSLSGAQQSRQTGFHLSQYDIMITQFAFVGFVVTNAKSIGLIDDFSQYDLESLLHFWRVIGFYLGAGDQYNLCSYKLDQIRCLCEAITEVEYRESIAKNPINSPPGIMSINIVRSVKFIPMLTIYGMMRYLHELLGIDTSEFENKGTRYSCLSYTLIKLVMSNLLQYRPLRVFNNGLTRLSLYAVGKIETWFGQRLESKYGTELNL